MSQPNPTPDPTPAPAVSPGNAPDAQAGPDLAERRQLALASGPSRPSPVTTHPRARRYHELPGEWTREQYPFF